MARFVAERRLNLARPLKAGKDVEINTGVASDAMNQSSLTRRMPFLELQSVA
jgi:hypothetical protein